MNLSLLRDLQDVSLLFCHIQIFTSSRCIVPHPFFPFLSHRPYMPYLTFDQLLLQPVQESAPQGLLHNYDALGSGTASGFSDAIPLSVEENVLLNNTTSLQKLYHYGPGSTVHYPETSDCSDVHIGHLFTVSSASHLYSPMKDFAYSIGAPQGSRKPVYVSPLTDSTGNCVPCEKIYATCNY